MVENGAAVIKPKAAYATKMPMHGDVSDADNTRTLDLTISDTITWTNIQFYDGATPVGAAITAGNAPTMTYNNLSAGYHGLHAIVTDDAAVKWAVHPVGVIMQP
jgi:hypothetical protein